MRLTRLTPFDVCVAQKWLLAIEEAMLKAQQGGEGLRGWEEMLVLKEDGEVRWERDERWAGKQLREAERAVRGFVEEVEIKSS